MTGRENAPGAAALPAKAAAAPPASEAGWLPDCVYTGGRFEPGLAFFADALGRITRFSREAADLAAAKRLAGQAALPGLVNGHSHALERVVRGRAERRPRAAPDAIPAWREARDQAVGRLSGEDAYDTARMAFLEMILSGITCVGEFHYLHNPPDGASWPDPNFLGREILRAAHDTGIRIALLQTACARACPARFLNPSSDRFIAEAEALARFVAQNYHIDEAWVGIALHSLGAVPLDYLKAAAAFAHAQRMRLHLPLSEQPADNEACMAENGRTPVSLLAKLGLLDKRFTAIHAIHLTDDEVQLLGAARATVCACPTSERNLGSGAAPVEKLLAAGAAVSLGTDAQIQIDLLEDARLLEYNLRMERGARAVLAPEPAGTLFNAATVAGARSLGAPGGALEVGRPADFFTINVYDPSIAGAEPDALLENAVFSLERRAIRDVWIGARQRIANGRHPFQGPIVGRFVDLQRRLWG
jgi:formimidoylglutamate deiminase